MAGPERDPYFADLETTLGLLAIAIGIGSKRGVNSKLELGIEASSRVLSSACVDKKETAAGSASGWTATCLELNFPLATMPLDESR